MESSQDDEECRSSESGWTMYLGSPMEYSGSTDGGDDDEQDQEAEEHSDCDNVGSVHGAGEDEDREVGIEDDNGKGRESDDSMASDASSRPRCPGFWAKSDEKEKQGKGGVQGRGKVRKNLKMGKK